MAEPHLLLNMTRAEVGRELVRIRRLNREARREKRFLDENPEWEQMCDDALKGIDRCYGCGRIKRRRK